VSKIRIILWHNKNTVLFLSDKYEAISVFFHSFVWDIAK